MVYYLLSGTQKVITSLILVVIELVSNTLCTTFMIVCLGVGFQGLLLSLIVEFYFFGSREA